MKVFEALLRVIPQAFSSLPLGPCLRRDDDEEGEAAGGTMQQDLTGLPMTKNELKYPKL
jgi:hypothetical protein